MCNSEIPAVDILFEMVQDRADDMGHLVQPVVDDLNERMGDAKGSEDDWYGDFLFHASQLKDQYHRDGSTGRYFVLDTLMVKLEQEFESE